MAYDVSPTARALLALEAIQNSPGITAQRLGQRLGVTERAARRYVAILRQAGCRSSRSAAPMAATRWGGGCGCRR
jgi:predicted DNA-binding transcriptional regulator YafY